MAERRQRPEAPDPVIRRAGPGDAAVLAQIGARLFEQTYGDSIPADEMAEHIAKDFGPGVQSAELADPSTVSYLVEAGGEVLGFAQIRRRALPVAADEEADVELWRIYLDRRLHGTGMGRRLLAELGRTARELGSRGVWLAVWKQNARALAFYEKQGFRPVGRQDFHVGGEVHCDLVLRAPLDVL